MQHTPFSMELTPYFTICSHLTAKSIRIIPSLCIVNDAPQKHIPSQPIHVQWYLSIFPPLEKLSPVWHASEWFKEIGMDTSECNPILMIFSLSHIHIWLESDPPSECPALHSPLLMRSYAVIALSMKCCCEEMLFKQLLICWGINFDCAMNALGQCYETHCQCHALQMNLRAKCMTNRNKMWVALVQVHLATLQWIYWLLEIILSHGTSPLPE